MAKGTTNGHTLMLATIAHNGAMAMYRNLAYDPARRLNADLNLVLGAPELTQRWEALGVTPLGGSVEDAVRRNAVETERWTKVIRAANIVAE